jgi:hypothetical protein
MIAALIALAVMEPAQAAPARVPVAFVCLCEDILGKQYASLFRDALARSVRYVGVPATAKDEVYHWKIRMVTVPGSSDSLAISVTVTFDEYYSGAFAQSCGSKRLEECVSDVMAEFDDVAVSRR